MSAYRISCRLCRYQFPENFGNIPLIVPFNFNIRFYFYNCPKEFTQVLAYTAELISFQPYNHFSITEAGCEAKSANLEQLTAVTQCNWYFLRFDFLIFD